MGLLATIRLGVYGFSLLVSLIVLALSAHLISQFNMAVNGIDVADAIDVGAEVDPNTGSVSNPFETVPLVAALFTLIYIVALFIIGALTPRSAMGSFVAEIVPLTLLWILWLVSGAQISQGNIFFNRGGCQVFDDFGETSDATQCRELQAVEGFGFVMWLLLFFYQCYLITFATMAQKVGRKVWLISVRDADAGAGEMTTLANNNTGVPMTAYAPQTGVVQLQQQV